MVVVSIQTEHQLTCRQSQQKGSGPEEVEWPDPQLCARLVACGYYFL